MAQVGRHCSLAVNIMPIISCPLPKIRCPDDETKRFHIAFNSPRRERGEASTAQDQADRQQCRYQTGTGARRAATGARHRRPVPDGHRVRRSGSQRATELVP